MSINIVRGDIQRQLRAMDQLVINSYKCLTLSLDYLNSKLKMSNCKSFELYLSEWQVRKVLNYQFVPFKLFVCKRIKEIINKR
jgi:hypothetical protein